MKRIIEVVPYDPAWKADFQIEKRLLQHFLSGLDCQIHHIGSTSIPGLAAKPIIDMLLECSSLSELDRFNDQLASIGYTAKGEYGIAGRRYFKKGGVQHSHHLHAYLYDDPNVDRHLAFRDYLRSNPDKAMAYQAIKMEGVRQCDNDVQHYMAHKNEFIQMHERIALSVWQRQPDMAID
ncbi:GrpB family protein [Reinekea blandensis]|uniref:Glutamate-rich protein grpB n=1 Tax=Reinekea blandensis MED297 TaxID=314283 RepID=A4BIB8_9GAMM|nr:GrpB family protein [Reinekea blandensis]EAR08125.1 hypothetical protein MED297_00515 [Reinekea sp. MED297] [Reinekea blandensis MED297]